MILVFHLPFDKHKLIGSHSPEILPLMVFIVAHTEHFAFSFRIKERNRERIFCLIYTPVVAQSEWTIVCSVVDGPPEVDDLEAVLEQLWDV
jgi:hypothetical protein